jgi:hypothetical protein
MRPRIAFTRLTQPTVNTDNRPSILRYLGFDDWDLGFAAVGSVGVTTIWESDTMMTTYLVVPSPYNTPPLPS